MLTASHATSLSVIHQEKVNLSPVNINRMQNLQLLNPAINHLLTNIPAYIDWKNIDSYYLGCSDQTAVRLAGLSSARDIVDRLDTDVAWGKHDDVNTYKINYLEPDKKVLNGSVLISIGNITDNDNNRKRVIIKKSPLLDEKNNIAGIISYLVDISDCNLKAILSQLKNLGVSLNDSIISETKKYITNKQIDELSLTKREQECLYYLLRNSTAKEIAKVLKISHRTVETYLNNLKDKFNCINKTALLIKAMELGCIDLIPDSILLGKAY